VHDLTAHFPQNPKADQPLTPGVHRLVHQADGSLRLLASTQGNLLLAQLRVDERGPWLLVAAGGRGIHVNGRPVRRMALLRAGDAVYVDGVELLVQGRVEALAQAPAPRAEEEAVPAGASLPLLRGVGGLHHGRSHLLDRPRTVGRGNEADIVLADTALGSQHARIERVGERLLLRDLGSPEGSRVNGVAVRHCWLAAGDQLVFDGQQRFVVEVANDPHRHVLVEDEAGLVATSVPAAPVPSQVRRWPWLLASALLLAGVLSLLLLFGAR